ncbi:hypothetical protein [Pseudonocardia sp. ICBG601]|uniref:hypothetical protein n=1 Tax=Pseudonocardia sp. ICBG601 TaxID=2846759 RepID=UPI001CF67AAC|nr:hypothetical protein [Pseudonocardia sp. ICBG601]
MAGQLVGQGWQVDVGRELAVSILDLHATNTVLRSLDPLPVEILNPLDKDQPVWSGLFDVLGRVTIEERGTSELSAWRGYSGMRPMSELLMEYPPTIFFSDGSTVVGNRLFEPVSRVKSMPLVEFLDERWEGVNLCAETKATAARSASGKSIHQHLEEYLIRSPRRLRHKWVLHNDGGGEFADYLVLEVGRDEVILDLWHAKPSGGASPSVRVKDLEVVVAQAIKSRRWMTDAGFWQELLMRIDGKAPRATLVAGGEFPLRILCGAEDRHFPRNFSRTRPRVRGKISIFQPGLGRESLEERMTTGELSAVQVRDLLAVFHDTVSTVAVASVWCSP